MAHAYAFVLVIHTRIECRERREDKSILSAFSILHIVYYYRLNVLGLCRCDNVDTFSLSGVVSDGKSTANGLRINPGLFYRRKVTRVKQLERGQYELYSFW
jgi:hypothetical protein